MQTEQIVALLIAERDRLERAIHALQGGSPRAARPAAKPAAVEAPSAAPKAAPARRKRKPMSAAARKEHSERMKAFWAARRKQKSK